MDAVQTYEYHQLEELDHQSQTPELVDPAIVPLPPSDAGTSDGASIAAGNASEKANKSDVEYLQVIAGHLNAMASFQVREGRSAKESEKTNFTNQGFASLAVVSVFLASLAVAFLSLVHDTIDDRPAGAGPKTSDSVIYAFCYMTVIFSLLDGIALGSLGLRAFVRANINSSESSLGSLELGHRSTDSLSSAGTSARSTPESESDESGNGDSSSASAVTNFSKGLRRVRKNLQEDGAVEIAVLLVIICPLMLAAESLLIALLVFVWAEQTLAVALAATLSFLYAMLAMCGVGFLIWLRTS